MLEGVGAIILIVLLLWVCSGDNRQQPRFSIEETQYDGFFEVRDAQTGETKLLGTMEQCEKWIADNAG